MSRRVDYLADLGITCLWLMPFYPTADRDDGYDITDFYGVDPRLGSAGDFVELVQTCRSRGIRVIIDFVMNHTSSRHPWFREARRSKDDPRRNWYVWRRSTPPDTSKQVVFPDVEDSLWELDEKTGEYYLHNFYKTQPDLNLANPRGPRRDRAHHGLLAAAGRLRVPHRRRALPVRRGPAARGRARVPAVRPARVPAQPAHLRRPPGRGGGAARRGQRAVQGPAEVLRRRATATSSPCSSTSSACRRSTCRWRAATRGRSRRHSWPGRRSTRPTSGRTSCATTTSSPSTS